MTPQERLLCIRRYGPRRPILRHILEVLSFWDSNAGQLVYGGTLEADTGYSDRAIRDALRDLVVLGWLRPEIGPNLTDPRLESKNQYGPAPRPRVHGHLGGCMPGSGKGVGRKTRYWITYRTSVADEPPPCRKVGRGNGAPPEGGTGRRDPEPIDPERGNGAPIRGKRAPDKGAPRSPDPLCNPVSIQYRGDTPPLPPLEGQESASPYGESNSLLGAVAPADPVPLAPEGSAETQGMPQQEAQAETGADPDLRTLWRTIVADLKATGSTPIAIRLWLDIPTVRPLTLAGGTLHLAVPTVRYADEIGRRFAATICAAAAARGAALSSLICHPDALESAA